MEKYNTIVKIEEIKRLTENGEIERAVKAAGSIEYERLRTVSDLSVIGEAFIRGKEYGKARRVYEKIYERAHSRRVVMQLVNLSIKLKDIEGAEEYLQDFVDIAPDDFYRYIFRYSIDKLRGEPYETLIDSLERLKKKEYIEKWAYELAKLYHKAGMDQKCVDECSDIILWFGEGQYVERAKALRSYYYGELDLGWLEESKLMETRPIPPLNIAPPREPVPVGKPEKAEPKRDERFEKLMTGGYVSPIDGKRLEKRKRADNAAESVSERQTVGNPAAAGASGQSEEEPLPVIDTEEIFEEPQTIVIPGEPIDELYAEEESLREVPAAEDLASNDLEESDLTAKELTANDLTAEVRAVEQEPAKKLPVEETAKGTETRKQEQEEERFVGWTAEEIIAKLLEEENAEAEGRKTTQQAPVRKPEPAKKQASEEYEWKADDTSNENAADRDLEVRSEIAVNEETITGAEDERQPAIVIETEADTKEDIKEETKEERKAGEEGDVIAAAENRNAAAEAEPTVQGSESEEHVSTSPVQAGEPVKAASVQVMKPTASPTVPASVPEPAAEITPQMAMLRESLEDQGLSYESLFGLYSKLPGMEKQLADVLEDTVTGEAVQYNYLITGDKGTGKTALAKNLSRYLYKTGCIATGKIALITAEKLNHINLIQKKESLADCCLIVEGAAGLNTSSAAGLAHVIRTFNGRIAVILEDTKLNMDRLIKEREPLMRLFKPQIALSGYTPENLADAVCEFITEKDYHLRAGAKEKLLETLTKRLADGGECNMETAAKIAEAAIERAERRNEQELLKFAESGKLEQVDLEGIAAEDFQ
ncbi:MAG: hypothetical protein J6B85_12600 [Lachnospiraceae bacterium]|nr:hypothetical protein [Lachnospiraceae bacterium]